MALKVQEREINKLLEKGGSAPQQADEEEVRQLQLRPEVSVVRQIDQALSQKPKAIRPSRHAWIMSAILEKLDREQGNA